MDYSTVDPEGKRQFLTQKHFIQRPPSTYLAHARSARQSAFPQLRAHVCQFNRHRNAPTENPSSYRRATPIGDQKRRFTRINPTEPPLFLVELSKVTAPILLTAHADTARVRPRQIEQEDCPFLNKYCW